MLRQDLQDLAARVKPEPVAGLASLSQQCALTVRLKNGRSFTVQREDAEGRNADGFKPYLEPKFVNCVEQVASTNIYKSLFLNINSINHQERISPLMSTLARAATTTP